MLFFGLWVHVLFCLVCYLFVTSTSVIDCLGRFVPEMTYYVSSGTLNLTNPIHKHTQMSSSYSSLDWVLSHSAHFTVRRFICVCVYLCFCFILHSCCEHGVVDLM